MSNQKRNMQLHPHDSGEIQGQTVQQQDHQPECTALAELDQLDDIHLIERTREGCTDAFGELYARYEHSALRLARHLGQREESDDVVSEAFARIFDLLQRGKGPQEAFRAYLYTAIRNESARRARAVQRVRPTDDDAVIDRAVDLGDAGVDQFERESVRAAYESLPVRWRTVLWQLDVEGHKPQDLADDLGISPNSVSALVYRARSGLREAYVQQHVNAEPVGGSYHLEIRSKFAVVLRQAASVRDQERVHAHLATCEKCMAVYLELRDIVGHVA